MGRGIPDRWDAYSAFGTVIRGTRFLPFKVPLKEALCRDLPGDQKFTPRILIDRVKDLQLPPPQEQPLKLGLVIDLTNTTRYYDPKELTKHNIMYEKIFTEGHNVPAPSVRHRFKEIVSHFLKENSSNGLLIGVHCTHGVNRTGYLVCRYMIDCMQANPADAIRSFNECRGHVIERENYLQHLATVSSASDLAAEMEASQAMGTCGAYLLPRLPPAVPRAAGTAEECGQPLATPRWQRKQQRRERKKLDRQQQQANELWRQQQLHQRQDDEHHWAEREHGDVAWHSLGHAAWQPPHWPEPHNDSRLLQPPQAAGTDDCTGMPLPHPYRGRRSSAGAAAAGGQWQYSRAERWSASLGREWDGEQLPGFRWQTGSAQPPLLPPSAAEHVAGYVPDFWLQPWQHVPHASERWPESDQVSRAWTPGYRPAVPLSEGEADMRRPR